MQLKQLTNRDLQRLFRKFNSKYFSGHLDPQTVVRFAEIEDGDEGETTRFTSSSRGNGGTILITKAYRYWPNPAMTTLLHEMAHISLGGDYIESHGYRFAAEITRLWNVGAYESLL